jgi:hypothetical protein
MRSQFSEHDGDGQAVVEGHHMAWSSLSTPALPQLLASVWSPALATWASYTGFRKQRFALK